MSSHSEWIKFRKKLRRDGRVLIASRACNVSRVTVLGALLDLWSLGDDFANEEGELFGWTAADLNKEVEIEGFCESLPSDWIDLSGEWVKLPQYQEHNGSTAKSRALGSRRAKKHREKKQSSDAKSNASSVTRSYSPSISNSINKNNKKLYRVYKSEDGKGDVWLTRAEIKKLKPTLIDRLTAAGLPQNAVGHRGLLEDYSYRKGDSKTYAGRKQSDWRGLLRWGMAACIQSLTDSRSVAARNAGIDSRSGPTNQSPRLRAMAAEDEYIRGQADRLERLQNQQNNLEAIGND